MTRTNRIFAPAALVVLAGVSFSPVAAQPQRSPLAGPQVDARDASGGLGQRNIDGSMRRPDIPVAEAALKAVDLDPATKAKIDALLAERAKQIDGIVRANLDTLNKMRTDRAAGRGEPGEPGAWRESMRQMAEIFRPVLEKGPLEKQIADLMPEPTREAYMTHIAEHREMFRNERRMRGPAGDGPRGRRGGPPPGAGPDDGPMLFEDPMLEMIEDAPPPPREGGDREQRRRRDGLREGAPQGERGEPAQRGQRRGPGRADGPAGPGGPGAMLMQMGDLRLEIRRSVERLTGEIDARQEDLTKQLDLTPEQAQKVQAILRRAREAGRDADNPRAARREAMRELREVLTPEQLEKFRATRQGARGERGQRKRGK